MLLVLDLLRYFSPNIWFTLLFEIFLPNNICINHHIILCVTALIQSNSLLVTTIELLNDIVNFWSLGFQLSVGSFTQIARKCVVLSTTLFQNASNFLPSLTIELSETLNHELMRSLSSLIEKNTRRPFSSLKNSVLLPLL